MSKRELIARELRRLPEPDVDRLLAFLRSLPGPPVASVASTPTTKPNHDNDWLTPEDEAWANS
jgi:hypothetical protein